MVDVDITTTELTWVTTDICSMGCFVGAANSVEINNTNTMSPTLGNFNFTHVLLGSNGVAPTLKQVRAQPPGGILDAFSILRRSSSSLIFVEVCPSSAEKVQHSLILEELTPGLSLEMHLLVLVVMRKVALFWPVLQSARCNTVILVTWDPGVLMNGMCANFHGFVLKSNTTCRIEIRFCRFSSQVAELFLFCCPACSIPNLHCTMDTKQISGDWLFSTTMELQWDATLTVITFDLGVQCVRLQPTVFKWSDHSCYDTNYLLAGAKVNREILLVRRAACTLWISCCLDNLHCSLRITSTSAILEWVISNPWPPPELQFLLSIVVLQPTRVGELQPRAHAFDIECEHLHWPCFLQETCHFMFSDVAVPSLVHAEREGWFQFCSAGKASLYSYGPAQFQWEIAWPPATLAYSIHYGMHMYLSLECSIVICYLESEIKCVPHMHWDPGGFSQHWLGVKTNFRKFAWLLMGSYLASSISGRSELVTLRKSMPPLNQLMLNVYHTFSPGTPIEVGLLKDVLMQDWLICLNGHIIRCGFAVTQWKIVWSFFCEYFDVGNQSRNFIPAATLTYPVWYFPWDPGIWACLYWHQAKATKGIKFEARAYYQGHCLDRDYYFDIVCADKDYSLDVFHDQVHFCDYYLGVFLEQVDVVCYINLVKVCLDDDDHRDLGEVMDIKYLWDPGGSTWHQLEVKPNFKEGGLSTTCLHKLSGGLQPWAWACFGTRRRDIYWSRAATMGLGLDPERKGGFGRGLAGRV